MVSVSGAGAITAAAVLALGCGRYGYEQARSEAPADASSADAAPIASDGASPAPPSATYVATVAECTSPGMPDPALCEEDTGAAQLNVDLNDADLDVEFRAYLRFDLDDALAGRELEALILELTASDADKAGSSSSGEPWEVEAFTRADLMAGAVPAEKGSTPLAPDQGEVTQDQVIAWPLPVGIAEANGAVFLGVLPVSDDGVNYWNLDGPAPPRLLVDFAAP